MIVMMVHQVQMNVIALLVAVQTNSNVSVGIAFRVIGNAMVHLIAMTDLMNPDLVIPTNA